MSTTQHTRQVLLDLLGEYRELETPVNPDLLKIFIDNATDRLDAIYQVSDLAASGLNANTDVANPPSDPKRKANT